MPKEALKQDVLSPGLASEVEKFLRGTTGKTNRKLSSWRELQFLFCGGNTLADGVAVDFVRSYCAFRTVEVKPDEVGVPWVRTVGILCVAWGYWSDGATWLRPTMRWYMT